MEAIILAGGFGTRLREVVADVPKPMAPIRGVPFLTYLFEYLISNGISRAVLCTGYKHEVIHAYYGDVYKTLSLLYSVEDEPLGTGGAIKKGLSQVKSEQVAILNGDTFFEIADLQAMLSFHRENQAALTIGAKQMYDFDRYGTLLLADDNRIEGFKEKQAMDQGYINGGVYILNRSELMHDSIPERFSFETEYMQMYYGNKRFLAYKSEGYFIDIGIPADYHRAEKELFYE
ncbi:NTP transferase domain-containing protein [Paenibacillus rhizovicinus]|uniref:NTP transferase domain-containing protein n=1 Tax=Paenibacillus rhizovicinus TaxID=2704463 RepID=A0A6C0P008_9BACL|nr:nucleotidyltransferase family protein [Paenibacillus rhizovicinus]QHW31546.1 NTP transferase domain-containing protein [Paenibacillus rhizovicinus]